MRRKVKMLRLHCDRWHKSNFNFSANYTRDWYGEQLAVKCADGVLGEAVDFEYVINNPNNSNATVLAQLRQGQGSGPLLKTVSYGK